MRHLTSPRRAILVGLLCLACGGLPTFSDPWDGHLQASVRGDTTLEYTAEAVFRVFRYPTLTYDDFNLHSRGVGASTGDWMFMETDHGRPTAGTYPVELHPGKGVFSFLFISESADSTEFRDSFTGLQGEVTINLSMSNRLIGNFDVVAARYCRVPHDWSDAGRSGSCERFRPDSNSPRVTIQGTFYVPRVANIIVFEEFSPSASGRTNQ